MKTLASKVFHLKGKEFSHNNNETLESLRQRDQIGRNFGVREILILTL
jgi:hypothetical protein